MLVISHLVVSYSCATVQCLQGEAYPRLFEYSSAHHGHHYYDLCAAVTVFWGFAVVQQRRWSITSPPHTEPSLDAKHVDP